MGAGARYRRGRTRGRLQKLERAIIAAMARPVRLLFTLSATAAAFSLFPAAPTTRFFTSPRCAILKMESNRERQIRINREMLQGKKKASHEFNPIFTSRPNIPTESMPRNVPAPEPAVHLRDPEEAAAELPAAEDDEEEEEPAVDPKISSMQERLNKINEELDEIISVEEAAAEALATSEAAKAAVEEVAKAAEMTEAKPAKKKKTKKEEAKARAKISDTISSSMQGAPEPKAEKAAPKPKKAAKKKATKAKAAEPKAEAATAPPPAAAAASGIQSALKLRMTAAMKGGAERKQELQAIRLMVSAMTTKQKEDGVETLSDEKAQEALAKLAKMRKESIEMFEKGGNKEAAEAERFELTLLEEYLPAMADEATVRGWIATAIEEACPDGPDKKLMGKVMGALMKAHKGEFDGKVANKWVGEMLMAA